jgi:hypothetical protein
VTSRQHTSQMPTFLRRVSQILLGAPSDDLAFQAKMGRRAQKTIASRVATRVAVSLCCVPVTFASSSLAPSSLHLSTRLRTLHE